MNFHSRFTGALLTLFLTLISSVSFSQEDLLRVIKEFHEANKEGKQGFGRFGAYDWLMSDALLKQWGTIQ